MTVTEALIEKIKTMPASQQEELLDFADTIEMKQAVHKPLRSLQGIWSDLNVNLTEADLRQARNEMWRGYTKETDDEK